MNCEKNQDLINSSFLGSFGSSNINNNNFDNINISSIKINPNLSQYINKYNN